MLGSIPESKRHLVGILVNKYMYVGNMDKQDPNTYKDAEISAPAQHWLPKGGSTTQLIKVTGYPSGGWGHMVESHIHKFHVDAYTAISSGGKQDGRSHRSIEKERCGYRLHKPRFTSTHFWTLKIK